MKIRKKSLLYFYIAFYPIIPVYFGVGAVSFYIYFNILFALILFVLSFESIGKLFNKTTCLFCLYVLSMVLSNFVHNNYVYVIRDITSLPLIAIAFLRLIKTEADLLEGIDVIVKVGYILGILGIIESITHFNFFSLFNTMGASLNYNDFRLGMLRILSYTSQTITYADYATMIACLAFYRVMTSYGKERSKFVRIYVVMCINVILTFSRSIILVFVIAQVLLSLFCGFRKAVRNFFLGFACVILVIAIISQVIPTAKTAMNNFLYMFLAVVSDEYVDSIANTVDNTTGIGHRFLLYEWVWNSVKGNLLFGRGLVARFRYDTGTMMKTAIEVQYLYTLFHNGIIAMVAEIGMYLGLLFSSFGYGKKNHLSTERGKLTFGKTCFALFLSQILSYFAVMQDTVGRMFFIIVFLFFSYAINVIPNSRRILYRKEE